MVWLISFVLVIFIVALLKSRESLQKKKIVSKSNANSKDDDLYSFKIEYPLDPEEFFRWVNIMPDVFIEAFYKQNKDTAKFPKSFICAMENKIAGVYDADAMIAEYCTAKPSQKKSARKQKNNTSVNSFVAIDFETATADRMACQLGLVVVEDLKIIKEKNFLIQPPDNYYDFNCTRIHGIDSSVTAASPTFDNIWDEIKSLLEGQVVIAHNCSFDKSVLNKALDYYGLPEFKPAEYKCTMKIYGGNSLTNVCKHLDIPLDFHHDAICDARACAIAYIKYLETGSVPDILATKIGKELKQEKSPKKSVKKQRLSGDLTVQDLDSAINTDNIFYNKKVVYSGTFERFPERLDVAKLLKSYGADMNTAVSSKTDIFIYGTKPGPSKVEKIEALISNGFNIMVLSEEEFYQALDEIENNNGTKSGQTHEKTTF